METLRTANVVSKTVVTELLVELRLRLMSIHGRWPLCHHQVQDHFVEVPWSPINMCLLLLTALLDLQPVVSLFFLESTELMTALLTVCHCQKLLTIPTTIMATWTMTFPSWHLPLQLNSPTQLPLLVSQLPELMTMLEYWPQFLDGELFHLEATSQLFSMRLMWQSRAMLTVSLLMEALPSLSK